MNIIVLCIFWIGWCAMHSLLIAPSCTSLINNRIPRLVRYYRLVYNGLSLATLLPLAVHTWEIGGETVFGWPRGSASVRVLLLMVAGLLFWGGGKRYDIKYFLGLKQLRTGHAHTLLSNTGDFHATGVFAITRHPWYLGSLLAIWSILGEYPRPIFCAAVILSLYLVVGTLLEERKILQEHGSSYRRYQHQVSMLFPWKWLKNRLQ
jgi:protein-S-isoprenylcysteine O-methyltransferase Ste14